MTTIIAWLSRSYLKVFSIISAMIMFFCYYLIGKNSKLKQSNENLNTQVKELNIESKKIVSLQNKQAKIAARPSESRDDIHDWMRDLYERSKK